MNVGSRILNQRNTFAHIVIDGALVCAALWASFSLRTSDWLPLEYFETNRILFPLSVVIVLSIQGILGSYSHLLRYTQQRDLYPVIYALLIAVTGQYVASALFQLDPFPRSVPAIFMLTATSALIGYRLLIRQSLTPRRNESSSTHDALIYGAGWTGVRLLEALRGSGEYRVVGFIDDNHSLQKRKISGIKIFPRTAIPDLVKQRNIKSLFLALPSASGKNKSEIFNQITALGIDVMTVPTMNEILQGIPVNQLREMSIGDLLGREPVVPIPALIDRSIKDKVVCVTGGAGSIGSEIARQAVAGSAKKLLLVDTSEFGLFKLSNELNIIAKQQLRPCEIVPILGSVLNEQQLASDLLTHQVDTLYHAAAYKHVPLVEQNICAGVYNNVFGTSSAVKAASAAKVSRFVLISTDKAVRPTNHMGASKRMAELIVQDQASTQSDTVFTMVRFGNVLGSSGSVVPIFESQIQRGGPIEVTHPEVTRYFMTIPEAASLVVQAGSIAVGGEMFVLEMGEPVKIVDLAQRMIDLSESPNEIEITFTGLRPGEKLFEELLIEGDLSPTAHSKIWTSIERSTDTATLNATLAAIEEGFGQSNPDLITEALKKVVSGFQSMRQPTE